MNNRSAAAIKNNFIASGLVQEGMEVVRNIRDQDWFLGNSFGASLADGLPSAEIESRLIRFRKDWPEQLHSPLSPGEGRPESGRVREK